MKPTKKEYQTAWNNHIDELKSLGWNLEKKDYDKLQNLSITLKALVKKASENRT